MKTKLLFYALILLLSFACAPEGTQQEKTIEPVNNAGNKALDPAKDLLEAVQANPDDHEGNSKKLHQAALVYVENKKYQAALTCLNAGIRNHYSGSMTVDNGLMMAQLYQDRYKKNDMVQVIYQALASAFPNNDKVMAAIKNTPISIPTFGKYLEGMTAKLTNTDTGKIDVEVANNFVGASELHAMMAPNDAENANHLHKAGEIARSMRAFPKAIDIYTWIHEKYPDSKKAAQALFMSAFTYDNELKQKEEARALYTKFLQKYPKDDFADDTKFLLENLGKSNEEIIEGFGNK